MPERRERVRWQRGAAAAAEHQSFLLHHRPRLRPAVGYPSLLSERHGTGKPGSPGTSICSSARSWPQPRNHSPNPLLCCRGGEHGTCPFSPIEPVRFVLLLHRNTSVLFYSQPTRPTSARECMTSHTVRAEKALHRNTFIPQV